MTVTFPSQRRLCLATILIGLAMFTSGCSETVIKHGTQFRDTDIQSIQPGMSQEQVRSTLGTPSTTAAVGAGDAFYYISSVEGQTSFMLPSEKDRQVVAVYFNQGGSVQQVAHYGLKDGKVFDFISRKTPTPGAQDEGILKSLFRNLGKKTNIFGDGT